MLIDLLLEWLEGPAVGEIQTKNYSSLMIPAVKTIQNILKPFSIRVASMGELFTPEETF